jgi:hypothetical protein
MSRVACSWSHLGFRRSILTATNKKLFSLVVDDAFDQLHFSLPPPDRVTSSMGRLASTVAILHTQARDGVAAYAANTLLDQNTTPTDDLWPRLPSFAPGNEWDNP